MPFKIKEKRKKNTEKKTQQHYRENQIASVRFFAHINRLFLPINTDIGNDREERAFDPCKHLN